MASSKRTSKAKKSVSKKRVAKRPAPKKKAPAKRAAVKRSAAKKGAVAKKKTPAKKRGAAKKAAPAKKPAAKKAVAPKRAAPKRSSVRRRDQAGHIDPSYARELLAMGAHEAEARPFVGGARAGDDLAEELAEEAVETMTTGEDESERLQEGTVPEETGGPFVVTTGGKEFAEGTDASNPEDADREPFPRT